MQVIILAAGMGNRLQELTENQTKCMVKVNGETLIERLLNQITNHDLDKIIIVIGYEGQKLKEYIGEKYNNIKIEYVNNEIYNKTNNIYSLYLAKEFLINDETILFESDLIFDDSIIDQIFNAEAGSSYVLVDKYKPWMDGTVVNLEGNKILDFIDKYDFDFKQTSKYFKTVNVYRFTKDFSKNHYLPFLSAYCNSIGLNEYYESVLKVIISLKRSDLKALILNPKQNWYEIDDKIDLFNAETIFGNNIDLYNQRYGGYWRFPELKDFCYLVNPYYPTTKLYEEIKASAEVLIDQYPSGFMVLNRLVANMFHVNHNLIQIGNGAAELIKLLLKNLDVNTIGIFTPTFNEYISSAGNKIKEIDTSKSNYIYDKNVVLNALNDYEALVLINPDNPTGNYLCKEDVLEIIAYAKKRNRVLIYDESFIDFSTNGIDDTIINNEIINDYNKLFVIKSISKSYGIPGLRLGVILSSDFNMLSNIRTKLPVWNINSLAEFYLQIQGKYKNDYLIGCEKISSERDRFFIELNKYSKLEVWPSQANYFFIKLDGMTGRDLSIILLKKYKLLIKDCTGKPGIIGENMVRIAVRDFNDNNALLSALNQVFKRNND